jgi:hypothetical protein
MSRHTILLAQLEPGDLTADGQGRRRYQVTLMRPGSGNGLDYPEAVVRAAVAAGRLEGLTVFVDHRTVEFEWQRFRPVRDIVGVVHDVVWDSDRQRARGVLTVYPTAPDAAWLVPFLDQLIADRSTGRPAPDVGLSLVVQPVTARGGRTVVELASVESCDIVFRPAREGSFERALARSGAAQHIFDQGGIPMYTQLDSVTTTSTEEAPVQHASELSAPSTDDDSAGRLGYGTASAGAPASTAQPSETSRKAANDRPPMAQGLAHELLLAQCQHTLASALAASDLPAPLRADLERRLGGRLFTASELDQAVQAQRALWAQLRADSTVRGLADVGAGAVGGHSVASRHAAATPAARVSGLLMPVDQLQAAVETLFGLPVPDALRDVPRLSGFRELYLLMTGDHGFTGAYVPQRAALANATTSSMAELVRNVMNKVVVEQWETLGRAGYLWWQRAVHEEDFPTLQQVSWVTVGGFGDLPDVGEGQAYPELTWDDSRETADWSKPGGYIGLTLEMIDRDDSAKIRAIPRVLATAALRTLSAKVAAIFTDNSGTGPTLSDGNALFHASHNNLSTTALSAAGWDEAVQTMFKQTELSSGKRLAVRPRYLLVPIEREKTALQILTSGVEPASNVFYSNVRAASDDAVVTAPEWTDQYKWAAAADPRVAPGIGVGYRFGRTPEIFISGDPLVGSMFTNDVARLKVRFMVAVSVINFRALFKSNATS